MPVSHAHQGGGPEVAQAHSAASLSDEGGCRVAGDCSAAQGLPRSA